MMHHRLLFVLITNFENWSLEEKPLGRITAFWIISEGVEGAL